MVHRGHTMNVWILILLAWAAMALLMGALWLVQLRSRNAGIVDVAWSFGTGLCGVGFALTASGLPMRRAIIAAMAGLWAIRLGGYLVMRMRGEPEDRRYRVLRDEWGDVFQRNMFIFFQIQAAWAVLFAIPMLLAARNDAALGWLDAAAALVFCTAVIGESVADRQLARFRKREGPGKVCRDGLWRYSRHPNYFFEWIHWWAYVLLGIAAPLGWLTLFGPALMLFFLLKVTGIPITERRLVESRGEAYRAYQRETSAIIPWPPKRGAPDDSSETSS